MAVALTVGSARAADYALRVEAPPDCGSEELLLEAIRTRSPGFLPIDWNAPDVTRLMVRFLPQDNFVLVELDFTDPSGAHSVRNVPARDCSEAVRASAWILTLLVDPEAAAAAEEAAASPPPASEAPEVKNEPNSPAAETAAARRAESGRNLDSPPEDSEPTPPSPPKAWQIGIGIFGGVLQTGLPETPLGYGGFVEWAWERESWFRPSARLAGLDAGTGVSHTDRGDVSVTFVGGRLSLCPVRTSRSYWLSTRACAMGELGRLRGEGQDTVDKSSASPTWYGAGPAVGVEVQAWSFLAVELEGAVVFPFNRDRFVFEPDPVQVGFEVPAFSGSLSLAIAGRI